MAKILKIEEKIFRPSSLPDGNYVGTWGGDIISLHYKEKYYQLRTDEGVRGVNFKVMVTIKDGEGTFVEIKN